MFWRQKVHCYPEGEKRMQKIMEIIKLSAHTLRKNERDQMYKVNQKLCCRLFFIRTLLNVSVSTVSRAKKAVQEDKQQIYDDIKKKTNAVRARVCEGFITSYINSTCDRDPTGMIFRMPVGITKLDLHILYKAVHKDGLEKSEFYNILNKSFNYLVFSKSQRFTKCTDCHNFRCLIEKEQNQELKAVHIARRNLHLREQQMEREAYYVRRGQAEMRFKEILSLILDGMDQNKTDIPHYSKWNNPSGAGNLKLRTHITGSIVHGRGKYFFVDHGQIAHDTNLSLSCLMKILNKEANNGVLPPTLYVQLDNTARENKNKYFLGMMSYLVKKDYVKEVFVSFLLVGHTHEDVDQCFSKISQKLKQRDAITMDELKEVIQNSQTPIPHSEEVGTVWNISGWLEPYINQIHNVSFPKLYRIYKDDIGHVLIQYKHLSTEDEWHPKYDEKPLEIFKLDEHKRQMIPVGEPIPVTPNMDQEDLKDLKRSLQKDFTLAQFSNDKIEWWNSFLEKAEHSNGQQSSGEAWPTFQKTVSVAPVSSLSEKEIELIRKYEEKRMTLREVHTKQKAADRRVFKEEELVAFKRSQKLAAIGKVTVFCQDKGEVEIELYEKRGQMFKPSGKRIRTSICLCFPGGFTLTRNGQLPGHIKDRLTEEKLTISTSNS